MENELKKLKNEIQELENEVDLVNETIKTEAKKKIQELKKSVHKLNEEIRNNNNSGWDDVVKTKFNEGLIVVKDSVEKSRKWMSEKIAP